MAHAIAVESTSHVVKSVADFVANYRTDSAIIYCIICFHVKVWRLKDRCREDNFIKCWIVIGIYRLRCHPPLGPIHGFAELTQLPVIFKILRAFYVTVEVTLYHLKRRVVAPFIRVTNLRSEFG